MTNGAPKMFLSYRREETAAYAGRLYDALAERFGDANVFMDIELEPGIDFVERITQVIGACHVLLVIVGPQWATLASGEEHARIAQEDDFVRLEVEAALRRPSVRVIPLLVAGARMPDARDLPEQVRGITRRNALELSDLRWRYDVGRLTSALEEVLAAATSTIPAATPPLEESRERAAQAPAPATRPPRTPEIEPLDSGEAKPRPSPPGRAPRPGRAGLLVGAAAVALVVVGLVVAGLLGGGGEDEGDGGGGGGGQPRVAATVKLGGSPDGLAIDKDVVWVTDQERNVVRRVNTTNDKPFGGAIPVGQNPDGVAAEGGNVWVANIDDGTVTRLTESDGAVRQVGTVRLAGRPEGLALGKQLAWVTTGPTGAVSRLDRATATTVAQPIGIGSNTIDVSVTDDGVFVSDKAENTVTRIDPASAEITRAPTDVGLEPRGLVQAGRSVWVANSGDDTVSQIDVASGRIVGSAVVVGDNPRDVSFLAGFVWVANTDSGTVTRIDAKTGKVAGKDIRVGRKPASIAAGAGSVWVSNSGDGTLSRIEP